MRKYVSCFAMSNVLRTLCITVLTLFILSATPALADSPHAWVWGWGMGPGTFDYWYPDQGDNTPGLLSDTMNSVNQYYGAVSGSASTSSGVVTLYARVKPMYYLDAWANILDTYRFYDLNNLGRTGPVPGLHAAITSSGNLTASYGSPQFWVGTDSVYTKGAFSLSWDEQQQQYKLRTYIPHGSVDTYQVTGSSVAVSAVFPFDISANFGDDFSLNLFYKASDWNPYYAAADSIIDFLSTATLSFYTDDPNVLLGVSSEGGFSQGSPSTPVPEPSTMLLLGSGLIGLAGYGRKKFFNK